MADYLKFFKFVVLFSELFGWQKYTFFDLKYVNNFSDVLERNAEERLEMA